MRTSNSLLQDLLQVFPNLRSQVYFKSTLAALSHAMEDMVLVASDQPLVIANFQQERFYRQETRRYQRIAQRTDQLYVLAAPDSTFGSNPTPYPMIPLDPEDDLMQEWHLIIIGERYAACLVCQEYAAPVDAASLDQARQFKGIWTVDRQISLQAAQLLLMKILVCRPELAIAVEQAQQRYGLTSSSLVAVDRDPTLDTQLFTERLVTYLQSSQYKQLKAYRTIATQERKERLINSITAAFRRSVESEEILSITVDELGQVFSQCRCLFYRIEAEPQPIEYESVLAGLASLKGEVWGLANHPLFEAALAQNRTVAIADVAQDLSLQTDSTLKAQLQCWQIGACLLVPITYQQTRLGVLELHQAKAQVWQTAEIGLVETIATQVGVGLIQAQARDDLATLNQRLRDLEQTQSNLIAIVGHELRTPLSTIQVCLESLASEANMPPEFQQIMLQTALGDTERLRRLIQDFLTLSRLESDSAQWQAEPISLQECLELALSSFRKREDRLPQFTLELPHSLPLVQVDGDGLIEVFTKLLDNACKFTEPKGEIIVRTQILSDAVNDSADSCPNYVPKTEAKNIKHRHRKNTFRDRSFVDPQLSSYLEVIIEDTGRGIEPKQLENIFRQFYQEEGYLRRTVNGTGLGLAICRQMIQKWGGAIWAESAGKNQGSTFHFTLPLAALA